MKVSSARVTLPGVSGRLKGLSSSVKSANEQVQTRTASANRNRVSVKA